MIPASRLRKLPRRFYLADPLTVAPRLLGKYIVRHTGNNRLIGRITEVEAYRGEDDPASHAYRGMTPRNEVMFREGGCLYVYFTYGMHFCSNVVTGPAGTAGAVLLRGIEPVEGTDIMMQNRSSGTHRCVVGLTDGPAKLCQALAIGRDENGADLLGDEIYLTRGERLDPACVKATRRIGITANISKKWRFVVR